MFPTLPKDAGVPEAFALNPPRASLLGAYFEELLRGSSSLSICDRELIATFVSLQNRCRYCYETHRAAAVEFGANSVALGVWATEPELTAATEHLRPLLAFAQKLTHHHDSMNDADAEAVYAAGFDEQALHDVIEIACTFNFMNRFVHGHGVFGTPAGWAASGRFLHEHGYAGRFPVERAAPSSLPGREDLLAQAAR